MLLETEPTPTDDLEPETRREPVLLRQAVTEAMLMLFRRRLEHAERELDEEEWSSGQSHGHAR